MSDKSTRRPDRRAVRTRDRLGDALIQLLLSKPFGQITVLEILDRAGVSRSTFYEHYRDKNDLFLSDVDQFLESLSTLLTRTSEPSARIAPVLELFTHVGQSRDLFTAILASGRGDEVRSLGEAHFARGIAQRLAQSRPGVPSMAKDRAALAHALAGALFSLLFWWMREGKQITPLQMERQFHRLLPD